MSMDLPELLVPERIRLRCDIHSKKRALQTVAELLGESLRRGDGPDGHSPESPGPGDGASGAGKAVHGGANTGDARRDGVSGAGTKADRNAREGRGAKGERGGKRGERGSRRGASDDGGDTVGVSDMDILDALISRERLGSTGLGHGVALPHSRLGFVDAPLAAMITLNEGVDFESGDGEPVDLVLGLLVPQDCNDEHLKILANLARRFNDERFRETLREQDSGEALFEHLQRLVPAS